MPFQKVEFSFPDEQEESVSTDIEIEDSGAIEVDISGKPPEPEAKEEVVEEVKASEAKTEEPSVEAVVEEAKADEEVEIPNSTVAEDETLVTRYQKAFDIDQFEIN